MIDQLEKKLSQFKFVTRKAEILTNLIIFHALEKNYKKTDDLFQRYLSVLESEPIPIARSKIIGDSLLLLNKFHGKENINNYINILLPKIIKPFFRLRARIDKLQYFSEMDEQKQILNEINTIDEDLDEIFHINFLHLIEKVINPIKIEKNSLFFIDKNSLDVSCKKYLTFVSELAVKLNMIDLIKSSIQKIDYIGLPVYRDITLRNIINNFYVISIKKNDYTLVVEIKDLSNLIKNASYRAETFYSYSICLKANKKFGIIKDLIDSLISIIRDITGEYSRAIILRESLKIILNLETLSIKEEYLEKIISLNEEYQGTYTSILVNMKIIEVLYKLNN